MSIRIVAVPYRYDEQDDGLGRGPRALLHAGLRRRLKAIGIDSAEAVEAHLADEERKGASLAIKIGRLGANTAGLVRDGVAAGDRVLVLAGDDTAAIGVVSGLQQALGANASIGVIWLDAHADFNTPETSYSGILAGMPVAILAGLAGPLWRDAAQLRTPLPTDRILIAGVRDTDEKEETLLRSTNVRVLTTEEVRRGTRFENAVDRFATTVDHIALHIDLDVLDPSLVPSASTPATNGLTIKAAARMITYVLATGKTATLTMTSLNPGAGVRGDRSVESALTLLENVLGHWTPREGAANHAES